jgi:glycosyltransferase involved in cell wall biosynthesis
MNKLSLTVIIPVKNEEKNLPKCLDRLDKFNQLIIVDSGSTDRTPDIAHEYGAEYHLFNWDGKFPKKRNWALRNLQIKNEWVLFLDADELISEDFIEEIEQKIKDSSINGYWLIYHNYFMGKKLKHGDIFTKLALFRVGSGEYERIEENSWSHLDMEVHEHPIINGKVGHIKSPIDHNDYRGMEQYINRHNAYSSWEAHRFMALEKNGFPNLTSRQKMKYRLMKTGWLPVVFFVGSYFLKLGFMDGQPGFFWARYKAHYFMQIQTKIMELKRLIQ